MIIKDISVTTNKNHVETEISFFFDGLNKGCYLIQSVYLADDAENPLSQITCGIPSAKVLTCADVIPAFVSTKEKAFPYTVYTKVFSVNDELLEQRMDEFTFSLPEHKSTKQVKGFFKSLFLRQD